jgi:hypothetical protein
MAMIYFFLIQTKILKKPGPAGWDKGFDAPIKDSTALRKCAKRTKKNNQKSASEPQKSKKLSSDALKNVFNALQV